MTPLYKIETCDCYPYKWTWDKKHYATVAEAQAAASEASPAHSMVRVMGRSYSGKWVMIGREIRNGQASTPFLISA